MTGVFEALDAALDEAGVKQRFLREPDVVVNPKFTEVVAAVFKLFGQNVVMNVIPVTAEQGLGVGDQRVEVQLALLLGFVVATLGIRQAGRTLEYLFGTAQELFAVGDHHLARHFADVVTLIGIRRERNHLAQQFKVTQPAGERQNVHLASGVVDVVFARHVPAGKRQQARQARAVGGAAAMTDVQGAGRIGRDEFDLHFLLLTERRFAEIDALREDGPYHFQLGGGEQMEIDESCAGDFGLGDERRFRDFGEQQLRQFARVALHGSCQLHGEIAGEITVRDLLRPFEHNRSIGLIRCDAVQRGTHQSGEVGLDILVHRQSALEMGQGADYTMLGARLPALHWPRMVCRARLRGERLATFAYMG